MLTRSQTMPPALFNKRIKLEDSPSSRPDSDTSSSSSPAGQYIDRMNKASVSYQYHTPTQDRLIQRASKFLHLLNGQDYSNPYFEDALLPHVICNLNGKDGTGIQFGLDNHRKVAKHNPEVKIEVVGASSIAYEKSGRGTTILALEIMGLSDWTCRAAGLLCHWRQNRGRWRCLQWSVVTGIREFH